MLSPHERRTVSVQPQPTGAATLAQLPPPPCGHHSDEHVDRPRFCYYRPLWQSRAFSPGLWGHLTPPSSPPRIIVYTGMKIWVRTPLPAPRGRLEERAVLHKENGSPEERRWPSSCWSKGQAGAAVPIPGRGKRNPLRGGVPQLVAMVRGGMGLRWSPFMCAHVCIYTSCLRSHQLGGQHSVTNKEAKADMTAQGDTVGHCWRRTLNPAGLKASSIRFTLVSSFQKFK